MNIYKLKLALLPGVPIIITVFPKSITVSLPALFDPLRSIRSRFLTNNLNKPWTQLHAWDFWAVVLCEKHCQQQLQLFSRKSCVKKHENTLLGCYSSDQHLITIMSSSLSLFHSRVGVWIVFLDSEVMFPPWTSVKGKIQDESEGHWTGALTHDRHRYLLSQSCYWASAPLTSLLISLNKSLSASLNKTSSCTTAASSSEIIAQVIRCSLSFTLSPPAPRSSFNFKTPSHILLTNHLLPNPRPWYIAVRI